MVLVARLGLPDNFNPRSALLFAVEAEKGESQVMSSFSVANIRNHPQIIARPIESHPTLKLLQLQKTSRPRNALQASCMYQWLGLAEMLRCCS